MLLLFDVFEVKNGIRARRFNKFIEDIITSLTKEKYEAISNKHNLIPYGDTPWKKAMVGGSDDRGFYCQIVYSDSGGKTLKISYHP